MKEWQRIVGSRGRELEERALCGKLEFGNMNARPGNRLLAGRLAFFHLYPAHSQFILSSKASRWSSGSVDPSYPMSVDFVKLLGNLTRRMWGAKDFRPTILRSIHHHGSQELGFSLEGYSFFWEGRDFSSAGGKDFSSYGG
ncbi:hypothetical protein PIB30_060567 [Stylosanthes scabra]|uniref:Uncharacterized protein n=1 Tax=Stylosanthes scabra TaxID=79078 RepID=A0ABU6WK77_9FABA|nr:hypothetical protein [Stylosanthes scabra]